MDSAARRYSTELQLVFLIVCWITSAELQSSHTNGPDDNTYPTSIPGRTRQLIGHAAGLHFIPSQRLSQRLIQSCATWTDAFRIPNSASSVKGWGMVPLLTDSFLLEEVRKILPFFPQWYLNWEMESTYRSSIVKNLNAY